MIRYVNGNLLTAEAEALVNTVNTVGVMGKGIALQFKEMFPENFTRYVRAVKEGRVETGKMFVSQENTIHGSKWIINFPTKEKWFAPSKYEWVEEGLKDLVRVIQENEIKSIAIPPLGCGNGRLNWTKVKGLLENYLSDLKGIDVQIYSPNQQVRQILEKEGKNKQAKLTPARAELLYALYHYEASGEEASLFVANKLAYFLQRLGDKQLKLKFQRHHYGPYSNQVDHLLYALNGTFLVGLEQRTAKAFDRLPLLYSKFQEVENFVNEELLDEDRVRLQSLIQLIDGFQSPLSMEVLATVDTILSENPAFDEPAVFEAIQKWSNRKKEIFSQHQISVAIERINSFKSQLGYA